MAGRRAGVSRRSWLAAAGSLAVGVGASGRAAARPTLRHAASGPEAEARAALVRAVTFFDEQVSVEGSYGWAVSGDLKRRQGEETIDAQQGVSQPPGTPAVGETLLEAWEATGEARILEAAQRTGQALVRTRLRSGGWAATLEFNPGRRRSYRFATGPSESVRDPRGGGELSTLDDDKSQACARFLIRLDQVLEQGEAVIHAAATGAVEGIVRAQMASGGWPQRFAGPAPTDAEGAERRASASPAPRETWTETAYWKYATTNDGLLPDVAGVLVAAWRAYGSTAARDALRRMVRFCDLARLPDPQPAWAQQYDAAMHPAWARKFEPPAISGGESQGIVQWLIDLGKLVGPHEGLTLVEPAVEYLRRSELPGGKIARFYELGTNRPLYFTKQYELTYDDGDVPTHYSFKSECKAGRLSESYGKLRLAMEKAGRKEAQWDEAPRGPGARREKPSGAIEDAAREAVKSLDARGAWVEHGRIRGFDEVGPIVRSETFSKNVRAIARYLRASGVS